MYLGSEWRLNNLGFNIKYIYEKKNYSFVLQVSCIACNYEIKGISGTFCKHAFKPSLVSL